MTAALLLAALLSLSDPSGDALGNGTLSPPTALVFRSQDALDVRALEVPKGRTFGFDLTFAHLSNPWSLPNGFSLPLIEVYLETKEPGQRALLPGSSMHLPEGEHWNYAFKLTGDSFQVFQANPSGGSPSDISERAAAEVKTEGNTIIASTHLPAPRHFELYAMVGSYDPFSKTGWRPLERQPSPWAYATSGQKVPVIDVLASTFELQERAVNSATLPPISTPPGFNRWLLVMGLGLLLILAGLAGRFWAKPRRPARPAGRKPVRVPAVSAHAIPPVVPAGFRAPPVVTVREKRLEPDTVPSSFGSNVEEASAVPESLPFDSSDLKAPDLEPDTFDAEPLEAESQDQPEKSPTEPTAAERTEEPPDTDIRIEDISAGADISTGDIADAKAQASTGTPEAPNDAQALPFKPGAFDPELLEAESQADAQPEESLAEPSVEAEAPPEADIPEVDIPAEATLNEEQASPDSPEALDGAPQKAEEKEDTKQDAGT